MVSVDRIYKISFAISWQFLNSIKKRLLPTDSSWLHTEDRGFNCTRADVGGKTLFCEIIFGICVGDQKFF